MNSWAVSLPGMVRRADNRCKGGLELGAKKNVPWHGGVNPSVTAKTSRKHLTYEIDCLGNLRVDFATTSLK
jgi:hypothetical protein